MNEVNLKVKSECFEGNFKRDVPIVFKLHSMWPSAIFNLHFKVLHVLSQTAIHISLISFLSFPPLSHSLASASDHRCT